MSMSDLAVIAGIVFLYALFSRWLAHRSISGPFAFVVAGIGLYVADFELLSGSFAGSGVEILAEAALVVVLFSDATRIDARTLRHQAQLPIRLLAIGLPLTIGAGTLVAVVLFPELAVLEAAVLAAILSPTDAALGQAVVSDPRVPARIRQALNVESGLNDGLMVPIVAILVALAVAEGGSSAGWVDFTARQLGFGLVAGVSIGSAGGRLLDFFAKRGMVEGALRQVSVLALAACAFASAEALEGNGFVAAFVAGLAFGAVAPNECDSATDFVEDEGELLILLTFLFWALLFAGPRLDDLTPSVALYVLASLTIVRMLPVAISLTGMKLEAATTGYLGWFGPRGLASILFATFAVEHLEHSPEVAETILLVVTWTVLASCVAHGLTAVPLASRYGRWFASMSDDDRAEMPETVPVDEMRTRG